MMRAPRGTMLMPLLLALGLGLAGRASAQECYSYRTEACPNKPNISAWRGKGEDPQKLAARAEAERRAARRKAEAAAAKQKADAEAAKLKADTEAAKHKAQEDATEQKAQGDKAPVLPTQPQAQLTSQPQAQLTSQPQAQLTSQPQAQDDAARARRLRIAGITLLSLGVAGAAAGGALVAIDGQPTCGGVADPNTMCPRVRDTFNGGVVALAVSSAAIITGVILIGVSARRRGEPRLSLNLPASKRPLALLTRAIAP